MTDPEFERLDETLVDDSESRLRTIQELEIRSGVSSEVHVLSGTPHTEIAQFAKDSETDLLIIATHGHSLLERFLLGSTTEKIVRAAPCPVLVIRDRKGTNSANARGPAGLGVILVATDFSERSVDALDKAVELAREADAEVILLHVLRDADLPIREVLSRNLWKGVRRRSQLWLEKLQAGHIGDDVRSRVLLTEGVPSAKIADVAAGHGADLIMLGAHGRSGLEQVMLGSTAERVVRVAPCSVYVERSAPVVQ